MQFIFDPCISCVFFPDAATGTEKAFPESTNSIRTTSLTTQHSTVATRTTDVPTDATDGATTRLGFVTAGGNATSYTNETQSRVTPAPATSPDLVTSSYHRGMGTTLNAFSDQSPTSDASTSQRGSGFTSTREARDDASLQTVHPEVKLTTSLEESGTLGNITDHPGNTSAPIDRVSSVDEGNFISNKKENAVLVGSAPVFALFQQWDTQYG